MENSIVVTTKKRRVKTGCITCRIRRIRCDEAHPSCKRCTSTGRRCDGYGILTRDARYSRPAASGTLDLPPARRLSTKPVLPLSLPHLNIAHDERQHLEWFQLRTASKLPGLFISCFWSSFLIQAIVNEDAVLHAVLALASVHKAHMLSEECTGSILSINRTVERRTLHHYIKAIRHLRPHLQANTKHSRRVALIVCIVLTSADLLRGHFATAKTHVECGEKLLLEIDPTRHIQVYENHGLDLVDTMIAAAFMRLRIQGKLFSYWSCGYNPMVPQTLTPVSFKDISFSSYNEAWQKLAKSMNEAFALTKQLSNLGQTCIVPYSVLVERHAAIKQYLKGWLQVHQSTAYQAEGLYCCSDRVVHGTLKAYHTMVTIMVNVCLDADDETAYDSQTELFVDLLKQLIDLYQLTWGMGMLQEGRRPVHQFLMSRSIVDMGNIPLLYHMITKCRVHRIRTQALRLLETVNNREGFWDSNIMSRVARRVVEIEERDFYKDQEIKDGFTLFDSIQQEDLFLPSLPGEYRLKDVEVVLSGCPTETVLFYCRQDTEHERLSRMLVGTYNVASERWSDEPRMV